MHDPIIGGPGSRPGPDRPDLLKVWAPKLGGYLYQADDDLASFPPMTEPPEGIVFHSGDRGRYLGEYATNEPDDRCVAYTVAWFESMTAFIQTVPFNLRAFHAGRAGNHWLGVGLPGPADRSPRRNLVRMKTIQLAIDLMNHFPGVLRYWCRHSDIADNRQDPGPGFKDSWMAEAGLIWKLAS